MSNRSSSSPFFLFHEILIPRCLSWYSRSFLLFAVKVHYQIWLITNREREQDLIQWKILFRQKIKFIRFFSSVKKINILCIKFKQILLEHPIIQLSLLWLVLVAWLIYYWYVVEKFHNYSMPLKLDRDYRYSKDNPDLSTHLSILMQLD